MGLFRIILALAVLVAHTQPLFGLRFFGGGVMAVECFFIISGFYMALVLKDRYRGETERFYFNRFIRLYPAYWMLLTIFLVCAGLYLVTTGRALGALVSWSQPQPTWAAPWGVFTNLTMAGGDVAELFSRINPADSADPNRLIVIRASWSISVEILFYLAAPWLLKARLRNQIACFLAALLLRWTIWKLCGEQWSHWLYYFAPATWSLFLAGVMAHHLFDRWNRSGAYQRHAPAIGWGLVILLTAAIITYAEFGLFHSRGWLFHTIFALSLPFVFSATRQNRSDAWLAGWSYPLYLGHSVVLSLYAPIRHFVPETLKTPAVLLLSILIAIPVMFLDGRIQKRFKRPD